MIFCLSMNMQLAMVASCRINCQFLINQQCLLYQTFVNGKVIYIS